MDQILIEIFKDLPQGAPGDRISTIKAFKACTDLHPYPEILDIGCGTGRQTLELAKITNGHITALDLLQPMLDKLNSKIQLANLTSRITCIHGDMADMKFEKQLFDLIWAEGSIYNIGFRKGLEEWKKYLKPNGYIAVTDLVWINKESPDEVKNFFAKEYPGMLTLEAAINIVEESGYQLVITFPVPVQGWINYYGPLKTRIETMRRKYPGNDEAEEILDTIEQEIRIYMSYKEYFDYVFLVMVKKS